jgi:hypothetical protein
LFAEIGIFSNFSMHNARTGINLAYIVSSYTILLV